MSNQESEFLRKNDGTKIVSLEKSKKFNNTKRGITNICADLSVPSKVYSEENTISIIESYLKDKDKMDRILYSEISTYVFAKNLVERGVIVTNVEKLVVYVLNNYETISPDCRKIVVKIYDHVQLASHQVNNFENMLSTSIDDLKENLENELKGLEREYVTILGIFAAIMLAFVSQITFSTSVLQNIHHASIYRLLMVIVLLAFVIINLIWMLLKFILVINGKDNKFFNIFVLNLVIGLAAIAIIIVWWMNKSSIALPISININVS